MQKRTLIRKQLKGTVAFVSSQNTFTSFLLFQRNEWKNHRFKFNQRKMKAACNDMMDVRTKERGGGNRENRIGGGCDENVNK